MPEKLTLTAVRTLKYAPGVEASVPAFDLMGFEIHREPTINQTTGALTGWQAAGSYVEVTVVGAFGVVETIRLLEGAAALTSIDQLNTANLPTKSLRQRLMELVMAYVKNSATPYAGTLS